jgi:hypothetical protein
MRRLLLIAALLFCGPAFAQQMGWVVDSESGCRAWGLKRASHLPAGDISVRWSGDCRHGYVNGRGTLQWFVNGRPAGRDEGEFRDGKLYGFGVRMTQDGARYEGDWRLGQAHGNGRYVAPNGNVLEGFWVNGCYEDIPGANCQMR